MGIKTLSSGWIHISVTGGFAQVPPHFSEDTIPDEYIFQPEWNRERINAAWRAAQPEATTRRE